MATVQENLATSLKVLKYFQDHNATWVIHGVEVLGRVHTERLLSAGYLQRVMQSWFVPSLPGSEGDSTVWYASYWSFIAAYCNFRFGDDWCLTAEESLGIYSGDTMAPKQLVVRSPKANNAVTRLMHDTSLLCIKTDLPISTHIHHQLKVRLYSLTDALLAVSESYFAHYPLEAATCLSALGNADEIVKIVSDAGNTLKAGRLAGALRHIGSNAEADKIIVAMRRLGYDIRERDPFQSPRLESALPRSPYATRIRLMWAAMRTDAMKISLPEPQLLSLAEIEHNMDSNYVKDSYHSLSIEGYRVTEGLIEKVRSGNWNPAANADDMDRRNALAARGYYQAYQAVRVSVGRAYGGVPAGKVYADDHDEWHYQLFEPSVQAGILKPSDLVGYRNHPVFIRGSRHTPLPADAVSDAMQELDKLMTEESNPFVRAVLGHFFFVYIHPYMDGNGRSARFAMNLQLVTAGYPWVVVPTESRDSYMQALEAASIEARIMPFAQFIASLVSRS